MATVSQAAAHVFLAARNFYDLLDRGVIERMPAGEYDLEIVREEYIRHLQKVAAGREKKSGDLDGEYEKARKDKELADRTALQNAQTRREVVLVADVETLVAREYAVVRERMLGIPGKLSGLLTPKQVERLDGEVREALEELTADADPAGGLGEPDGDLGEDQEDDA